MLIRRRNPLHVVTVRRVRRKQLFHIMKIVARTTSGGRTNHNARLPAAPCPRRPPPTLLVSAPPPNEDGRRCPNTDGGIPHAPHKFSLFSTLFAQHLPRRLSVAAACRGTDSLPRGGCRRQQCLGQSRHLCTWGKSSSRVCM